MSKISILYKMNGTFQSPLAPHFNGAKMAGFGLRAPSSLLWDGGKDIHVHHEKIKVLFQ